MRILCDQMVKESYVEALASDTEHTVARVRDELRPDAIDDAIATYATANEWVVLTADDDYFDETISHGLLYYEDGDPPSPGALRDAVRAIDAVYDDYSAITEWVPDGWV
jgi:hypothetical protein